MLQATKALDQLSQVCKTHMHVVMTDGITRMSANGRSPINTELLDLPLYPFSFLSQAHRQSTECAARRAV
eukprot:3211049-Pleurochrysis_carterae.AAC.1